MDDLLSDLVEDKDKVRKSWWIVCLAFCLSLTHVWFISVLTAHRSFSCTFQHRNVSTCDARQFSMLSMAKWAEQRMTGQCLNDLSSYEADKLHQTITLLRIWKQVYFDCLGKISSLAKWQINNLFINLVVLNQPMLSYKISLLWFCPKKRTPLCLLLQFSLLHIWNCCLLTSDLFFCFFYQSEMAEVMRELCDLAVMFICFYWNRWKEAILDREQSNCAQREVLCKRSDGSSQNRT